MRFSVGAMTLGLFSAMGNLSQSDSEEENKDLKEEHYKLVKLLKNILGKNSR